MGKTSSPLYLPLDTTLPAQLRTIRSSLSWVIAVPLFWWLWRTNLCSLALVLTLISFCFLSRFVEWLWFRWLARWWGAIVHCLCTCNPGLQIIGNHYISGLQYRWGQEVYVLFRLRAGCIWLICRRVSGFVVVNWHHIYQHQGSSVSFDTSVHYFQESDDHSYCIRRSVMVWGFSYWDGTVLLRPHGSQLGHCGMGRYPTCTTKLWPCNWRSFS